jgi:hypothetical protein
MYTNAFVNEDIGRLKAKTALPRRQYSPLWKHAFKSIDRSSISLIDKREIWCPFVSGPCHKDTDANLLKR